MPSWHKRRRFRVFGLLVLQRELLDVRIELFELSLELLLGVRLLRLLLRELVAVVGRGVVRGGGGEVLYLAQLLGNCAVSSARLLHVYAWHSAFTPPEKVMRA